MSERRWFGVAAGALVVLALAGCGVGDEDEGAVGTVVNAEEAKADMLAEVTAAHEVIGENWSTSNNLTVPGPCNSADPGASLNWSLDTEGTVSLPPDEAVALIEAHLQGRGFTTEVRDSGEFGIDVVASKPDGLFLQFGVGFNGAASVDAQSVCFPPE